MVHSTEPGLPRTDVSGSEFEVGAPTSEEEAQKKKSVKARSKESSHGCFEGWLLSILHCRFLSYQWRISCLVTGEAETIPGVFGHEDVSTGVEVDGQLRGRHIVVTKSLALLPGRPQHDVSEVVHSRGRSQELLEQAFVDGNICVQLRILLVLLHDDSKSLPHLRLLDKFVTDPATTVIRATGHQMVSLCRSVCEEEKAQRLSPPMNS